MVKAILEGILSGLVLSCMIGPVFFGLLHASIYKGFRKAVFFALGVASSDSFFIMLTYFGVMRFLDSERFKFVFMIVGGSIMCVFGIYYLFKSAPDHIDVQNETKQPKKANLWLKGFVLNAINPSVFLFWIGMVSFVTIKYDNHKLYVMSFFIASIITVFSADISKAYIANKIKVYFTTRLLNKLNKALGIVILAAGLSLLYKLIK